MALSQKQKKFVEQYLIDLNATQAAIRAGYSARTADRIGPELLGKTCVSKAIAEQLKARSERTQITQDRVLLEIARLAFSDPRKAFDETGKLKSIQDWPDEVAASISSIKTKRLIESDEPIEVVEVRFWDKNAALDKASKHLGLYEADNRQSKPDFPQVTRIELVAPNVNPSDSDTP